MAPTFNPALKESPTNCKKHKLIVKNREMGEIGRNRERGREVGGGGTLHIGTMHTE